MRGGVPAPASRGFTLVELLVVASVIALLVGILLPALGAARAAGRSAVCLSGTRSMAAATLAYAVDHRGSLLPVRSNVPGVGVRWWFGLQAGFGAGVNRPIDLTGSPLSAYTADLAAGLSCPEFPFDDPGYVPKFATPSAHHGYNGGLAQPFLNAPPPRRLVEVVDAAGTFVFADAVHQEAPGPAFFEPHEVAYRCPGFVTGAGHFRHGGRTVNVSFLDGHAAAHGVPEGEAVWATFGGSPVVNLDGGQGPGTRYGFATWTYAGPGGSPSGGCP